ncbi:hypothetical protein PDN41_20255 [Bacillus cereus]|uniref:hypothetical protein n=1 Tax=Bacillus mycoides TaxID=1405 RepID=UPI002E1A3EB6|nr:hypothetical protein [Bacillus cereus]MED1405276.1 hypothetical protein [Bacillus mycoides]
MIRIKSDTLINTENFEVMVELFQPKIQQCIKHTPLREREDLEQELKLKIYEKINLMHNFSAPGFFEFIETVKKKNDVK